MTTVSKPQTADFLIIGQGLAGSLAAWMLAAKGVRVAVVDNGAPLTSSKVAAGMFNPINTKRFTVMTDAERLIEDALSIYQNIEQQLEVTIVHRQPIYNVFGNTKEGNDYTLKLEHPFFNKYTESTPQPEPHIRQPFGVFEVSKLCGWVDIKTLLTAIRNWLQREQLLIEKQLDYAQLTFNGRFWNFGSIEATHVISCEGYQLNHNPYFKHLKIVPCKGDVLEFEAPGFNPQRVIKKGIYIVPLGENRFRCGSTYRWFNDNEQPKPEDMAELSSKIAELIDVPFTITSHVCAVRPTTRTRDIIVDKHPEYPNLYAVNGLGTKGVMNGIKAMRQLMDTLGL